MQVFNTVEALRSHLAPATGIVLVPTMGNLHAGHISLMQTARQHGSTVVASIFVNPLQFGANEDLTSYPRTPEADLEQLQQAGVDVVFTPSVEEMYPALQSMSITPPPIAAELCGAARPGHFAGVATVVMKLFNIVQPQAAVFGKKDFQQLFIIRELIRQFNLPIALLAADIVREEDGLALSSRNAYLSEAQRIEAPRLYKTLQLVVEAVRKGGMNNSEVDTGNVEHKRIAYSAIEAQTSQFLTQLGWIVDYISIRAAETLSAPTADDQDLIVLGAARQGRTRLIDNIRFSL